MSYVTGISGNVISAASAGWAPTNSAEVSAIASAYATGSEQVVTAVGTSDSGITSINNSGLVDTAALRSADYSSLYVQEPLYISSTGDSSYIGISGDIGGIDSATCSAIASAYAESAASSKQDTLTFGYDSDKISAINGSALAGGSQVVSAVGTETAYTPDGVSDVVTSINGNYISALSADSAFQASYDEEGRELTSLASEYEVSSIASAYAESAVSGKADSSALSSYALSADVSGTVDLVSTQSANWGGSALALSAGPGVKLEKVGDTLVASTDETLLWSGTTEVTSFPTTESPFNFKRLRFVQSPSTNNVASDAEATITPNASAVCILHTIASPTNWGVANTRFSLNTTGLEVVAGMNLKYSAYNSYSMSYMTGQPPRIGAIYGINRTAEA